MRISVLCENYAGRWTKGEHGLSLYIEDGDDSLLFDTGSTDVFIDTARYLGLDIENSKIVLSHGHDDHVGGLRYLNGNEILAHPSIFTKRFRKKDNSLMDLIFTKEEMGRRFSLSTSSEPLRITENIFFLGQIPRLNSFESGKTPFFLENGDDDFVDDDSGIAVITPQGLVVISGCAHSGICNMTEYASSVTGIEKIHAVFGGFHLLDRGTETEKTAEYFLEREIEKIYPCHCSEFPAMSYIYERFPFYRVKTGDRIEF